VVVRHHEDSFTYPRTPGRRRERLLARQRVAAPAFDGEVGKLVDPDERRPWNVLRLVRLTARVDAVERVAAVDELVPDQ
jgi:hypothetical protein